MLRTLGIPHGIKPKFLWTDDSNLKKHNAYHAAKAGDQVAAFKLVTEVALGWLVSHRDRFDAGAVFVAPHAVEATGDNAIPQTLAAVCSAIYFGQVDTDIVQTSRVYHTGADPMERMAKRALFEGRVTLGTEYVLVDDVTSLGGTLAELANYIQQQGGVVKDIVLLVNAGRNREFAPNGKFIQLIQERFNDEFTSTFGIYPIALTANEAQYLVGFKSIDAIRNRLSAAKKEIDRRLRSKGITPVPEEPTITAVD